MKGVLLTLAAGMLAPAIAAAHIPSEVVDGCELYGANMGNMWAAVHDKHMTLEQLNEGIDHALGKQYYYRTLSEQQAVLDNPKYKGAPAMNVAIVETAECIRRRS